MKPTTRCRLGLLLLLAAGCDRAAEPVADPRPPAVKRVAVDRLPALGDYLPDLDQGRLRVAPPAEWTVTSRSSEYLVQFVLDRTRKARLPRIQITARDTDCPLGPTLAAEQVEPFADWVRNRLQDEPLLEEVRPMIIGDTPCARYVKETVFVFRGEGGTQRVRAERQLIVTLAHGRLYEVDLHIHPGTILDHRDQAYAVVAGLRFPSMAPADEPPADDSDTGDSDTGDSDTGDSDRPPA